MDRNISFNAEQQKFRTPISSAVQNKQTEDALFDLLNLSNRNNKIEKSIVETSDLLFIETAYRDAEMNRLLNEIKRLKEATVVDNIRTLALSVDDMYIDGSNLTTANIDKINNCITLPYSSSVSKTVLKDEITGETFVPSGLVAKTVITNRTGILSEEGNSPLNALRSDHGIWYKRIITEKGVNLIEMNLEIELPDTIIDTRDVNTIIINTFPYRGMDITGIFYKLYGDWIEIPGVASHIDIEKVQYGNIIKYIAKDCGNIMLGFKDVSAKSIKICFRQSKFVEEAGKNVFYIGARNIEILNRRYEQMSGSVFLKADMKTMGPVVVHDILSVINNKAELTEDCIQYELFALDENDMPSRLGSLPLTLTNGKMLIKCNIYRNIISPNIAQIQVKYSV